MSTLADALKAYNETLAELKATQAKLTPEERAAADAEFELRRRADEAMDLDPSRWGKA